MNKLQRKLWLPSLLLGLFLMGTNLVGQFVTLDLIGDKKITSSRRPYKPENRAKLLHMIKTPMEKFDLEAVNETVFTGIIHTDQMTFPFYDNWLIWFLAKLRTSMGFTHDPERIINAGGGLCSQASAVLNRIASLNGHPARFIALNGHTLSEIRTHRGWQVSDPDYGIVYPVDFKTIQSPLGTSVMENTLKAKGYNKQDFINTYIKRIQNKETSKRFDPNEPFTPRITRIQAIAEWLKWILPLFLIFFGLWSRGHSRRKEG